MAEISPFRFRAFLSYSHRDTAWGKWLHGALESYRIDKDLIGRKTPTGAVPKTLRPIFRDREDFSAGHSLNDQTLAALEASQFLLVLCSPNAARSPYVNEEIRRYKAFGRADYVIPIIVDGEPGDPQRECFPPALRFKITPDGALTDEREEPIAADARPQGDGKDIAKLKVVAGLLGLGLDEIMRRAERARRRRLRNWVAALGGLTVTFAALAVWADINRREANVQRQHAEEALDAAVRTSNSLTGGLAIRLRNQAGMPAALVKYILDQAQQLQQQLASFGRTSPDLQRSEARALLESSLTLLTIGDTAGALARADRARQIIESLLVATPDDADWQLNLALSYERSGDALRGAGKNDEALAAYRKALAIAQREVDGNPGNAASQSELAINYVKIGDVLLYAERKPDEALAAYQMSLAIRERFVDREPGNDEWRRGLAISYERVGEVLLAQGKREEALAAFQKRLAIAQELVDRKPDNTGWQRDLSVAYNKVGDVSLAAKRHEEALAAYQKALAIRQKLADSDQGNPVWQRDVAISHYLIGNAMVAAGRREAALASFQTGIAIEQKLAAIYPGNAELQADLYLADITVGGVLMSGGELDAALKFHRDGLAIAERQARAHPDNAEWQRKLLYSISEMGALAYRFVLAREFAPGLAAAEQSISLAPGLIWLYGKRAHALMFLDRTDEARALYLRYRGENNVQDRKSWETVIRADFIELHKAGLAHPLMDEIEKQFANGG